MLEDCSKDCLCDVAAVAKQTRRASERGECWKLRGEILRRAAILFFFSFSSLGEEQRGLSKSCISSCTAA